MSGDPVTPPPYPRGDFRSDTVTRPDQAMREAMATAEVGDDVFGDDPTVKRLEARAAALFGKEAGIFVPSGTMANLLAVLCHTRPGDTVVAEARSHTAVLEAGAIARFAGVRVLAIESAGGAMDPSAVRAALKGIRAERPTLVAVENTSNFHGGKVVPLSILDAIHGAARDASVPLHFDGARALNACVAAGLDPREYGTRATSLFFALSKGLGCPAGSVLLGDPEFIERARGLRRHLGGSMRQVGVLAAPGLHALDGWRDTLARDHALARRLHEGLATLDAFEVTPPETNIVLARHRHDPAVQASLVQRLADHGYLACDLGPFGIRFVTHKDVDEAAVDGLVARLSELLRS